ncbi:unnamed protein product [Lota lota]
MGDISLTIMSLNVTCSPGNHSAGCPQEPNSSSGLAAGLSVLFLLVFILVAVTLYVKRRHSMWWLDRTGPGKMEDSVQVEQRAAPHQYSPMYRAQGEAGQSPIYENYSGLPPQDRSPRVGGHTSFKGPEEDLYYQSDSVDDAIYSNDPNCSLAMLPEPEDGEDLYIMPDVL